MTTTTDDGEAQTRSPGEEYLRNYHDRRPGRQSIGTESARLEDGRTSYELLADRVTDAQAVLDLGCADGALLAVLAARGVRQLAGIDLSEQELALARWRPELADADLRCDSRSGSTSEQFPRTGGYRGSGTGGLAIATASRH